MSLCGGGLSSEGAINSAAHETMGGHMRIRSLKAVFIGASLMLNFVVVVLLGYLYSLQPGSQVSLMGLKIKRDKLFFETLSLGDAQLRVLRRQTMEFQTEVNKRQNLIIQEKKRLIKLLREEIPNTSAIESTMFEIGMREDEIRRMVILHFFEHKSVLGKEQRQKYVDLIETALLQGGRFGCPLAD